MMRTTYHHFPLLMAFVAIGASRAFAPPQTTEAIFRPRVVANFPLFLFDEDRERQTLTRETEPEEFFSTNTDKMSDEEKIPIALAGLAGISLPFIFGLVALYAAQG